MAATALVWFRLDLRLADNPALHAASKRAGRVVPVFIWPPQEESHWSPGAASRWWLHQSLRELAGRLAAAGAPLVVRRGPAQQALERLVTETGASAAYWNRRYEPTVVARDTSIKHALTDRGVQVESFNSALLCEPWEIATKQGKPFQVFTPYWRAACGPDEPASPLPAPKHIPGGSPTTAPHSEPLDALQLEPTIDWAAGMREHWHPGEVGAIERLQQFVAQSVAQYADHRDLAAVDGVSQLSPHLHFGELGPRQVWHAVQERVRYAKLDSDGRRGAEAFLTEIGWREFAHHLLFHFPHTTDAPLREKFANFPWVDDHTALRRWQRGLTGYPMVDAGMRQLWRLGWMHNRVRMIVASFLVKDLLVSWREGARWFWDTLVDADLANNTLGWQWTAGCGADAAPFFRIFNPTIQGEKLDPAGDYVRRWVPELSRLPTEWIHRPWQAPADVLKLARVELDRTYPRPMVDHDIARRRALQVLKSLQASNS